jgi:hypothetical protein
VICKLLLIVIMKGRVIVEYKIISGYCSTVETKMNEAVKHGWRFQSHSNSSSYEIVVIMYRSNSDDLLTEG